jgi:hypothetical protein
MAEAILLMVLLVAMAVAAGAMFLVCAPSPAGPTAAPPDSDGHAQRMFRIGSEFESDSDEDSYKRVETDTV